MRHILVLPIVSAIFLCAVSASVMGNALRPGLLAELALVAYVTSLVLLVQRRRWRGVLIAAVIIGSLYALCLGKWIVLREAARVEDLALFGEVWAVTPPLARYAFSAELVVLGALFVTNLAAPSMTRAAASLFPLVIFAACSWGAPVALTGLIDWVRPIALWDSPIQLWRDGPLFTLMRELPRRQVLQQFIQTTPMAGDDDLVISAATLARLPAPVRSLHIIQMESFIDPRTFHAAAWPSDPLDQRLRRWTTEGDSLALSPTFGGTSARTEFEVLCGAPAYGVLGVELQVIRGGRMPCLPAVLAELGYETIASVASEPAFFNVGTAYEAVGFTHRHFADDFAFDDLDGEWLSNDSLFAQNRRHLDREAPAGHPVLNYVVTWVGHSPFVLNLVKRPPVFGGDTEAIAVANAAYYNSRALADFIEAIEARDPRAVIIAYGDHLPPMEYTRADHRLEFRGRVAAPLGSLEGSSWFASRATPLVVRRAGVTVRLGVVPHYLIPEVALDLITDGAYCAARSCLHRADLLYRPNGRVPIFSNAAEFPQATCPGAAPSGEQCRAAQTVHERLQRTYAYLLRQAALPKITTAMR